MISQTQSAPPHWAQSVEKTLSRNPILQKCKLFQSALYDVELNRSRCDTLRCWDFVTKVGDVEYLKEPKIVTVVDNRAGFGALLHRLALTDPTQLIELNWCFALTNEKIRLLCKVSATVANTSESVGNQRVLELWQ